MQEVRQIFDAVYRPRNNALAAESDRWSVEIGLYVLEGDGLRRHIGVPGPDR